TGEGAVTALPAGRTTRIPACNRGRAALFPARQSVTPHAGQRRPQPYSAAGATGVEFRRPFRLPSIRARGGRTGAIETMALPDFSMRQLLEAGVHFGHTTRRWNPKMQPFIFG